MTELTNEERDTIGRLFNMVILAHKRQRQAIRNADGANWELWKEREELATETLLKKHGIKI